MKGLFYIKNKLLNPPILRYPDFDKKFILTTDASNYALGAVLSQGVVGLDLPISYASISVGKHDLNKLESRRNYSLYVGVLITLDRTFMEENF